MYLLIVWSIFLPDSLLNQPTCKNKKKIINKCHLRNFRVYPIITRPDLKPEYPKPENPNYNIGRVSGIIFLRKYPFYPKPENFTRSTPLLRPIAIVRELTFSNRTKAEISLDSEYRLYPSPIMQFIVQP